MKKLLLLSSALVVGGQAFAADLPVKAPPVAAVVPYSWSGCHVGGHVGAGWDHTTFSDPGTLAPTILGLGPLVLTQNIAPLGAAIGDNGGPRVLGGVQAGCDYQFANNWVIGVGGDFSWTDLSGVVNDPFFAGKNGRPSTLTAQTDRLGSITGRIGYAWDRVLLYGKGGAAYAHDKYSVQNLPGFNNFVCGPVTIGCIANGSTDRWGWTAGVGLEWAFAANWSAMIEYDHYGFDNKNVLLNLQNFVTIPANMGVKQNVDTVKVGINYRFWSPAPVVARY